MGSRDSHGNVAEFYGKIAHQLFVMCDLECTGKVKVSILIDHIRATLNALDSLNDGVCNILHAY